MAIKSNKENHTVSWIKRMNEEGRLNKEISIQRKEVWDLERKSNLIVSVLCDIPIESLLFEESCEDQTDGYNVLDGKQRTITLCEYLGNTFALSRRIRIISLPDKENRDECYLVGKKFSDLPEEYRNRILDYEMPISILRPLNPDERALVFFMRNQAVPLTKMDLSRVMIGETAMDKIQALCDHNFMQTKINLTKPARKKREDMQLILQYVLLKEDNNSALSGRRIMQLCDDIKDETKVVDYENIQRVLDYLDDAVMGNTKFLKKVHIPVIMSVADIAMGEGMPAQTFWSRLADFFEGATARGKDATRMVKCPEYFKACESGSAKAENVRVRTNRLKEAIVN